MPAKYASHISKKKTPQSKPIPGSNQVQNSAGGYSWSVDKWNQLNRFLILGSEGGTYYVDEQKLTTTNATSVVSCIKEDGLRVVDTLVKISDEGRAAKNDPALFVLALVFTHGDIEAKKAAKKVLPKVARIGTHLFTLASYVDELRGWGRLIRSAFSEWYLSKNQTQLFQQMTKYAQRNGWSHRDILRLAHPQTNDEDINVAFKYAVKGYSDVKGKNAYLDAVNSISTCTKASDAVKLIVDYKLPREVVPTQLLNEVSVWEALLQSMPMTAMLRNLGKMTSIGLLKEGAFKQINHVVDSFMDVELLKKSRLHPISILMALRVYSNGRGMKGDLSWRPVQKIVDALNEAFYLSFKTVQPTGKNLYLALDVSGSMGSGFVAGSILTPREASAALALVTANVERNYIIKGFSSKLIPLDIGPGMRLNKVISKISHIDFGSTDCALPMIDAYKNKYDIDAFFVYTDNETWYGQIHPSQALSQYQSAFKSEAKLAVVSMVANNFSIADPDSCDMLDVVGFDTSTPQVLSQFILGEI